MLYSSTIRCEETHAKMKRVTEMQREGDDTMRYAQIIEPIETVISFDFSIYNILNRFDASRDGITTGHLYVSVAGHDSNWIDQAEMMQEGTGCQRACCGYGLLWGL